VPAESGPGPAVGGAGSLRVFFGAELARWRRLRGLPQDELARRVLHSRALLGAVERGDRWPPRAMANSCDDVLATGGALGRLWPVVDAQRLATRRAVGDTSLATVRDVVLRLAVLTGADLSALKAADVADEHADEVADDAADMRRGHTRR
jgi:hypothetical protein